MKFKINKTSIKPKIHRLSQLAPEQIKLFQPFASISHADSKKSAKTAQRPHKRLKATHPRFYRSQKRNLVDIRTSLNETS